MKKATSKSQAALQLLLLAVLVLSAVAQDHQDGVFSGVTDVVEKIGGQAPQSLEDFVRAHRAEFTGGPELSRQAQREMRKS